MEHYASQEERHPYLNAGLGLRCWRTLSLEPGVELAEAYRRLSVEDFTTRSLAQLVRHVGGLPEMGEVREGPLVSVIVRTRDRPELLAEALASLAEGTWRRAEVVWRGKRSVAKLRSNEPACAKFNHNRTSSRSKPAE